MNLHRNGFELRYRPVPQGADVPNYFDQVGGDYYRDCEELVKEVTGGAMVMAFHHRCRETPGATQADSTASTPVLVRHNDYSYESAEQTVEKLKQPQSGQKFLRSVRDQIPDKMKQLLEAPGARYALVNVWRNTQVDPVEAFPLSCIDAQTIEPSDFATQTLREDGQATHELYMSRHNPKHKNYFYPRQTRNEALLIKCWDSAGTLARTKGKMADREGFVGSPCTMSLHGAVDIPGPLRCRGRSSLEVRCLVVYDPNQPTARSHL